MEDLVRYCLKVGEKLGVRYVEARFHRITRSEYISRNGQIIGIEESVQEGLGVRVLVDGTLGFSSTNRLDKESIEKTVTSAYRKARLHSQLMRKQIEFSDENFSEAKYGVSAKKPFDAMSIEDKINLHTELWGSVTKAVKEAKIPVLYTYMIETVEEKIVANSDGAYITSRVPRIRLGYNLVVSHPQRGVIQRTFYYGASGGLEWLDEWNIPENLASETKVYEEILLKAAKPPAEEIDVVVGSEVVGLIVHESCGHPSEADRILGREAAQAGKSFIKPGMIGEKIGSEYATVIDDPTIPGSYGFYLYDDEGVPARARYLYKEGVINEHLHNRWTAKVFGVNSNASARSMNYRSEPIIRMANTYLKPGDYTFDELIEDIKYGVYIKSYMEWNIDDERWSQRYVGLEAYLIENGEFKTLIKNPVLEVTTKAFYSRIDAVDKNLRFYAGTCGKGEPAQGIPVWFGGPNVRLKGIRLGVAPL